MYAHSSTFYLSRSGSKLIERPSYVTAVADLTENGRLVLHVQKNPRKFRDTIILWSDVIDDDDDDDDDALALMTH